MKSASGTQQVSARAPRSLHLTPGVHQHLIGGRPWPPAPGTVTSNRDAATAFAAEHAKRQLQRLNHAARALPAAVKRPWHADTTARLRFLGPSSPDLASDHHQSRAPVLLLAQLWSSPSICGPHKELDRRLQQPCGGECRPSGGQSFGNDFQTTQVTPVW